MSLKYTVDLARENVGKLQRARRVMLKTYVLLHDPSRHTTGVAARDSQDQEISFYSVNAVKFCLVGGRNHVCDDMGVGAEEDISLPLFDQCAVELHAPDEDAIRDLRPAAYVQDTHGHEAALKILRCSMAKVRAELKRRKGQ